MDFRPPRRLGVLTGLAISGGLLLGAVGGGALGALQPVSLASFGWGLGAGSLFLLALVFLTFSYGCWSLRYGVNRNGLIIHWGPLRQTVPLSEIRRMVSGTELSQAPKIQGINWPGYHIGRSDVAELGSVLFYSTHRTPQEILFIVTPRQVYAISPGEPHRFMRELRLRERLGVTQNLMQSTWHWPPLRWPVWWDRTAQLLGLLALGLNLLLFAYVCYAFPALPERIALHFTPLGQPASINPREEIFQLPLWGGGLLALNLLLALALHGRHRLVAYFFLMGAVAVEGVLWVGTARILF